MIPQITRDSLSRSFAILARNGTGMHFLFSSVHEAFPIKGLSVLDADSLISCEDILAARNIACMVDPMMEAYLDYFSTPENEVARGASGSSCHRNLCTS